MSMTKTLGVQTASQRKGVVVVAMESSTKTSSVKKSNNPQVSRDQDNSLKR